MTKALFLDLDGTVISSNYQVSKKNIKAIQKIKKAGWKVYIATGKSFSEAIKWSHLLKLDTPMITSQGQVIVTPTFEFLKFVTQDFCDIKTILNSNIVKSSLRSWSIETVDALWTTKIKDNEILKLFNLTEKNIFEYKSKEDEIKLLHSAILGVYFDVPKTNDKELLKFINKLNETFKTKDFQYWYTDYDWSTITIKPKHIDKWSAIKVLKEKENLDFIVSIGNGWSDKCMIENSDIGIAMKNSQQKIKDSATWVSTYNNNEDGVAYEIEKLLKKDFSN